MFHLNIIWLIKQFNYTISDGNLVHAEIYKDYIWEWAKEGGVAPNGFSSRQEVFEMCVLTIERLKAAQP
jgi:hypothetical protein